MTSKRLYLSLIGVIGLLFIGLLAGAYGANSLLTSKANKLTALKASNQALEQEQQSLTIAKKNIQKYGDLEKIAKTIVPQDKNQAEAVREIVNLAGTNNISLTSISFPTSSLGNLATGGSSTSSPSAATTAPSPAANLKSPTNALSQLQPVKSIPGVYLLPITISNDNNHPATYANFINFLHSMEHNRRTAQVSTISLQPLASNPAYFTFSLTLNEYIKP